MKLLAALIATLSFSTVSLAEESLGTKLDQKTKAIEGAAKKKAESLKGKPSNEPSMKDKAIAKKDEMKAKADAAAASVKQKIEAKKAEDAKKPSAADQAKDAAKKAEGKLDGAIEAIGK